MRRREAHYNQGGLFWSRRERRRVPPLRRGRVLWPRRSGASEVRDPGGRGGKLEVSGRKGQQVEERLRRLMQELGNAINESLSESDRIAEVIGEIRGAGYDVFLVLEATIGFNRRREADEEETGIEGERRRPRERAYESTTTFRWTSQDQKFLKAMRISLDDDAR